MINHNRYAYETDEECPGSWHTVPWGNWGVNSNVGEVMNADQFQGWLYTGGHWQWNSCSVGYIKPDLDCNKLNFPDVSGQYLYPEGYPFKDSFAHNDSVPPYGSDYCVDQFSPPVPGLGSNDYGAVGITFWVPDPEDTNCDGTFDFGGCKQLDGSTITISDNFMTIYELDGGAPDALVSTLYFEDVTVQLSCNPFECYAVLDLDQDGWVDDRQDQQSPSYLWPIEYQDDWGLCYYGAFGNCPASPSARLRIDATIRAGYVHGVLQNPPICDPYCDPRCEINQ